MGRDRTRRLGLNSMEGNQAFPNRLLDLLEQVSNLLRQRASIRDRNQLYGGGVHGTRLHNEITVVDRSND